MREHQPPSSPEAPYPYSRVALAVWLAVNVRYKCQASPGWGIRTQRTLKRKAPEAATVLDYNCSLITAAIVATCRSMT